MKQFIKKLLFYSSVSSFIYFAIVFTQSSLSAQTAEFIWAKQSNGESSSEVVFGITTDGAGNSIITGSFRKTIAFGSKTLLSAGEDDIFIVKYNSEGIVIWAKNAGGIGNDRGWGITTDEFNNIYVTGNCYNGTTFDTIATTGTGVFVVKYDATGNVLWARVHDGYGDDHDLGYGITVDKTGNTYVTGQFRDTVTFGTTTLTSPGLTQDMFIVKYDASGNVLWAKQAEGAGDDRGCGISTDESGNIFITGYFNETATFNSETLSSSGSVDIFIVKYDPLGNLIWAKKAGGTSNDQGSGIATNKLGNIFVTGFFSETVTFETTPLSSSGLHDIFIAKYNTLGNLVWAKKAGGNGFDRAWDIVADDFGYSFITGGFYESINFGGTSLTSSGSEDIFAARYDSSGNVLWIKQAGGVGRDYARSIAIDDSGNSYIAGSFDGAANFGNIGLNSGNLPAVFLSQISDDVIPVNVVYASLSDLVPSKFSISNYPNPFNSSTLIEFNLPKAGNVEVSIFNSRGDLIDVLLKENMSPGYHEVIWNPYNHSSGLYFARLIVGNYCEIIKLAFIK